MKKANKPKPQSPGRAEEIKATYFLAKQSGLFQPGQPFILAHTLVPRKTKGKPK